MYAESAIATNRARCQDGGTLAHVTPDGVVCGTMIKIYVIIDPRNNEIRYVGKTKQTLDKRLGGHLWDASKSSNRRARWIAKLLRLGYQPRIELIQEVPESCWRKAEHYWIDYYRSLGCTLTNGTEGGDGGDTHTADVRAKMSKAKKGQRTRLGAVLSDETKAKISAANSGKSPSIETRVKMSAAHTGQKRTPEQRANMSGENGSFFGHTHTSELRAHMSAVRIGKPLLSRRLKIDWSDLVSLYDGGMTLRELAARYQCSVHAVRDALSREGGRPRSSGESQRGKKLTPTHRAKISLSLMGNQRTKGKRYTKANPQASGLFDIAD